MTPVAARKLTPQPPGASAQLSNALVTEDAISYARGLGFSPAANYKKACRVFGGITTAGCAEQFVFGKDDKPLYIQGPSDSPAGIGRILHALDARCGEGGYHYIIAADDFEPDGEEESDESAVSSRVDRTGLERMAAGLRATGLERMAAGLRAAQPGMEVWINPPGQRKISDAICLVAAPLLEYAPEYEWKEMILSLTTLAWNFTLLDPIEQRKMRVKIADLLQSPERIEVFYYLANRKALLFPEEERFICKVEVEPALYGDVTLRVASAM